MNVPLPFDLNQSHSNSSLLKHKIIYILSLHFSLQHAQSTEEQDIDWKRLTTYSIGKGFNNEIMAKHWHWDMFRALCKHFFQVVCLILLRELHTCIIILISWLRHLRCWGVEVNGLGFWVQIFKRASLQVLRSIHTVNKTVCI